MIGLREGVIARRVNQPLSAVVVLEALEDEVVLKEKRWIYGQIVCQLLGIL